MPSVPSGFTTYAEALPAVVPHSSAADVIVRDVWVEEVILCNSTTADITVTIQDKQSTPAPLFKDYSVAAKDTAGARFEGAYMSGGINWQASATGLFARIRYKY